MEIIEKKYQVFISSTYTDLKEEREKAINSVLKLEHIPIGMELFNAGDDAQWAIIERAIESTDYYILIVAFRYGSVTKEEISYTEKEYDYAISKGIPVMAFIKDRSIPVAEDDRESKIKYQKKLDAFISKAQKKEVNYWKNPDELAAQITTSLVNQIKLTPRIGWVRADFDPIAISQEIAVLSKENRDLRKVVDSISNRQPDLEISILDPDNTDEEATLEYSYQYPKGIIHISTLTIEDDLTDEIKDMITEQDLQEYNNELPAQEEIDNYNSQKKLYENAQNNAYCFRLGIENKGNAKANNISIDLLFPESLLAYYDYDIEDIPEPKVLDLPDNPVWKAYDKLHAERIFGNTVETLARLTSQLENIGIPSFSLKSPLSINTDRIRPGYFKRDHFVDEQHDSVTVKVDSVIHSRIYTSDKIWFIATKKGVFTVECAIMCEEYESPVKYTFNIEVK